MKLVASIQFIFKFFLATTIIITFRYISRHIYRGFVCGDPSISLNKKPDTITNAMLVVWGFTPIIILIISEIIFNYGGYKNIHECVKKSWRNAAYMIHRYLIDILLMHGIIQAVKFFTRTHRPHFFETCKPDMMWNCTLGTFVSDYTCTNKEVSWYQIIDASMSFFSGHAATCVYSCFFIIWYIQRRTKGESLFLIPFVQGTLVCLGYYGAISRVFDHRHHWYDVLTGAIAGVITAYHTCYVLCNNSYSKPEPQTLPTDINNTFLEEENKVTVEE